MGTVTGTVSLLFSLELLRKGERHAEPFCEGIGAWLGCPVGVLAREFLGEWSGDRQPPLVGLWLA